MRYISVLLGFSILVVGSLAKAKEIYYGNTPEVVRIKYGESKVIRFDQEVKTINGASRLSVGPADQNDPDYSLLSVAPRFTKGKSNVVFILSDGSAVRVKFVVTKYSAGDGFIELKPKSALVQKRKNRPQLSEIELMKAVLRGDKVIGFKSTYHNMAISSGVSGLSMKLVKSYKGDHLNGYVYKLRYSGRKELIVDIRKLTIGSPNLAVVAQTDSDILTRKNRTTLLRIITKSSASGSRVKAPFSVRKKEVKNEKS